MKLPHRIKYYLLGFGIGLILVIFIFGTRGCEWLPNNRVLTSINSSQLYISNKNKCILECNSSIEKVFHLIEAGNVDFSNSKTKDRIREYVIEYEGINITVAIDPNDSVSTITSINSPLKNCNCDSTNNEIVPLYMPNKMTLSKLKVKSLTIDSVFQCQLNCLELDEKITNDLFSKGTILMNYSYPKRKPNPLFLIKLEVNKRSLLFLVQEGATKTRLKQIVELSEEKIKINIHFYRRFIDGLFYDENCPCL